jgi:MFS transporter, MHS family, shikimate and dehydroshikimate transport protein
VSLLIFARVADRVGKYRVAFWSALGQVVLFAFPYFWLLNTRQPALIWLAMAAYPLIAAPLYAVTGALLAELFVVRVRCSGISLGYQFAGVLGGAPAPFIATYLLNRSGGATWPVAMYVAVTAIITLVAVYAASQRPMNTAS